VKTGYAVESIESEIWVVCTSAGRAGAAEADGKSAALLPAFDEMILSYADRSALFGAKHGLRSIVSGGVIKPIVVSSGQVVGTWSRQIIGEKVAVTVAPLGRLGAAARTSIEKAAEGYAAFLGKPLQLMTRPY